MEKLRIENLVPGDVYYQKIKTETEYIARLNLIRDTTSNPFLEDASYIGVRNKIFKRGSTFTGSRYNDFSILRKATYTEVKWLQKCEEAGKYVEKPTVCAGHHVKRVAPIPFKHATKGKKYYTPNVKLKF